MLLGSMSSVSAVTSANTGVPPWKTTLFAVEAKVIAAHCVHIDSGEMRTLLHAGAGVAHNPSSNLKLASGFATVMKMLETGLNVGIGTELVRTCIDLADELGFNRPAPNSIDAVTERDFAAEFAFCAALAGVHLSRLAESVILFTSVEFDFF